MMPKAFLVPLAAVACASLPSAGAPVASPARSAPRAAVPAVTPARSPVAPVIAVSDRRDTWARLQEYLPALRGKRPEIEFERIGAYAPALDAGTHWSQLAAALDAHGGRLGGTCAGGVSRFLALLVDDPTRTSSIGRREPEVRVFWMPLAHVAAMTVDEAIRAAGLVDGVGAPTLVRDLRHNRDRAEWVTAVERSPAWFLAAGNDPSIHPRRIRGYAVAGLIELEPYLVHVGVNAVGELCEVATVPFASRAGLVMGPVRAGAERVCQLAGVRDLPECAP